MVTFTLTDLHRWLKSDCWPCVTAYLPTSPMPELARQGSIRLKNLLKRAEEKLNSRGIRPADGESLLKPGYALVDDQRFWATQEEGLAIVLRPEGLEWMWSPLRFPELVSVGRRICIKPVLPLVTDNAHFHLLAVSQKHVRLFRGDRWRLRPVALDTLPPGLVEALNYQPPQGLKQVLGAPAGGRGSEGTLFHGQGGEVDRHKDELTTWFRLVDEGLHAYLREERAPLLFAGVGYLFPIYQQVNQYRQLFDRPITGSPDHWNEVELHGRATELLGAHWKHSLNADQERFEQHLGSNRVSSSIEEVLAAARDGRVETVFVARQRQLWGRCDPMSGAVTLLDEMAPASEELLDRAAFDVLAHGGRAYALDEEIHDGNDLAALFRF